MYSLNLSNKNVLPLKEGCKIALWGRMQNNYYKSGTGSGGLVNVKYVTNIVDELKKLGIETVMLTGDNTRTANGIGKDLGLDRIIADVLPQETVESTRTRHKAIKADILSIVFIIVILTVR